MAVSLPQSVHAIATPLQCHNGCCNHNGCCTSNASSPTANANTTSTITTVAVTTLQVLLLLGGPTTAWAFPYVLMQFHLSGGPATSVRTRGPQITKLIICYQTLRIGTRSAAPNLSYSIERNVHTKQSTTCIICYHILMRDHGTRSIPPLVSYSINQSGAQEARPQVYQYMFKKAK